MTQIHILISVTVSCRRATIAPSSLGADDFVVVMPVSATLNTHLTMKQASVHIDSIERSIEVGHSQHQERADINAAATSLAA